MARDFLLAVLTLPVVVDGEVEVLEALLEEGLPKLHIRKPGVPVDGLLSRLAPRWASRLVLHGSVETAMRYGIPQVHGKVGFRDGSGMSGGGPVVDIRGTGVWRAGLHGMGGVTVVGGVDGPGGMSAVSGVAGSRSVDGSGGTAVDGGGGVASGMGGVAVSTSVHSWEEFALLPEGLAYAFISPLYDSISKPGYGGNGDLLRGVDGKWPCLPVGLGGIGGDTLRDLLRWGWKGGAVLGWIWDEPGEAVNRYRQLKKILDE